MNKLQILDFIAFLSQMGFVLNIIDNDKIIQIMIIYLGKKFKKALPDNPATGDREFGGKSTWSSNNPELNHSNFIQAYTCLYL